ncbi:MULTISPECIES: hypothetical protein [unclassified Meiothermus]|uniref:hypothetical protein n=1 Tax=unclassified Meiothermus TaxID=370471 RepID=UPI000D7C671B|nr:MULTISPECIES: hypothetical protein [unclassified Meiothermus]PZA06100.1 hypothetical protein DNA98_15115 [Meiothermus sp. Pnk-1]RYM35374.1 hypothetical protein EWH23_11325 [Meiothermus sp. PNK-Is4]
MPGRAPKRKGDRVEREVVTLLKAHGLEARRVPLSGAAPGWSGDVVVTLPRIGTARVEVKSRKHFKTLEGWLEGSDLLVLKPDRRPPLVVLPLSRLLEVLDE